MFNMAKCFICMKEKTSLVGGICPVCRGEGADDSLYLAIKNKDKELIKKIEDRVKMGKIVRIM